MSRLPPELYALIVRHTPLTSIDLVVRNRRGEMLLGLRTNRPARGWWFVPGGRFGKNETFARAFLRITGAELGVARPIEQARFLGAFEHFYDDNFSADAGFGTHYVVLAYALDADGEALTLPRDDQHSGYRWLSEAAARNDPRVHPNSLAYYGR